jgi:hypothetical protein
MTAAAALLCGLILVNLTAGVFARRAWKAQEEKSLARIRSVCVRILDDNQASLAYVGTAEVQHPDPYTWLSA